jgi:hypothetical protein
MGGEGGRKKTVKVIAISNNRNERRTVSPNARNLKTSDPRRYDLQLSPPNVFIGGPGEF